MNTANLQLEGVYATLTAILGALCEKGVLEAGELDALLAEVERSLVHDSSRPPELRGANVDAICFPARFLRLALRERAEGQEYSFGDLAGRVGRDKSERGAA